MSRLVKTHCWYHVSEVEVFSMTANVYSCEPRIHRKLQRTLSMRYYAIVLDWTVSATVCAWCQHFESLWYNFCAHGVKICITSVTALRPRFQISLKFDRFFFNLKQFDTIWCRPFLRTCNAFNAAMPKKQGRGKLDIRPGLPGHKTSEVDRCWSLYRFGPMTNATNACCMLQLPTASLLHVFANVSNMSESATNTSQGACMACTQCWPDCPYKLHIGPGKIHYHCDNMWHALYGSYMHAPIFSAVQLPRPLARFLELPRCFSGFASATTAPTVATRYHTLLLVIGCNLVFLFQVHCFATSLPLAF